MSERCTDCESQIKRLKSKPFFETIGREGALELARTLHVYGHDRAEIVIDEAVLRKWGEDGADRVPSPSAIWALCNADPRDFESQRKPATQQRHENPNCERCGGTGWEAIERGIHSGVQRCRSGCAVPARDAA